MSKREEQRMAKLVKKTGLADGKQALSSHGFLGCFHYLFEPDALL